MLGWIGFGVPHWHAFRRFNGTTEEYYGLWAYCQEQAPLYNTVCKRWSDAAQQVFNGTKPSFISTADGLITTGMIFLSLGLIGAVFALILPLLALLAAGLTFIGFLLTIIGIPIFGRESDKLSSLRGDTSTEKRYGFGLMIATIVLSFLAAILFLVAGILYNRFGFGNIASRSRIRIRGGNQALSPYNVMPRMPYTARPQPYYGVGQMPTYPYPYPVVGLPQPSLLSQYIARRMPRYYGGPAVVRRAAAGALLQPSVVPMNAAPAYVTPAYYRAAPAAQQAYAPYINLTGRPIVGPVVRTG